MNLWAKRIVGQLTVLAVALFFFSCEDQTSLLGFKNPKPKFNATYKEIPLDVSVLLVDSLTTSNRFSQGETNRFLIGKYSDPELGEVSAQAYTQFFTATTAKDALAPTAELDSVSLELKYDYYVYGIPGQSSQTISVHELAGDLKNDYASFYFNKTKVLLKQGPALGTKTFSVDDAELKKYITDKKDTTLTVHIPLDLEFGARIFSRAVQYRDAANLADSSFVRFREFIKEFKGVAIVPDAGDKVVGFSATSAASAIILHYHDAANDSLKFRLPFVGTLGYSRIFSDRSSTALAGLKDPYTEFFPASNKTYTQSGVGIVTKVDFSNFYEFADSIDNIIVNSAELVIAGYEADDQFPAINEFSLRALTDNDHLKFVPANQAELESVDLYKGWLTRSYYVFGEKNGVFKLERSDDGMTYSGFMTMFAQQALLKNDDRPRFNFVLYPEDPAFAKSVNRLVFDKNNLRLRIYYTKPETTENPD